MVFGSILLIIAVGVLVIALITRPFSGMISSADRDDTQPMSDEITNRYKQKLQWLRDLEIELQAGKVDLEDYSRQKAALQTEAIVLLNELEQSPTQPDSVGTELLEHMITDRRMERSERSAGFCVKCGGPVQRSDQFCPICGMKLQ